MVIFLLANVPRIATLAVLTCVRADEFEVLSCAGYMQQCAVRYLWGLCGAVAKLSGSVHLVDKVIGRKTLLQAVKVVITQYACLPLRNQAVKLESVLPYLSCSSRCEVLACSNIHSLIRRHSYAATWNTFDEY